MSTEDISFVLHISVIQHKHHLFTKLFVTIINTFIYTYLLVLLLCNYYYFKHLTFTKLLLLTIYTHSFISVSVMEIFIRLYSIFFMTNR